jgi:hypothetical protein
MNVLSRRIGCAASLLLAIGACSSGVGPTGVSSGGNNTGGVVEAEYEIALKKWQQNAPVHYRIVVQQTCECADDMLRPTRVTVRRTGGQSVETIEEVVDDRTGDPVSTERRQAAKSVDGLLVLISQALSLKPADSRITYDATLGYPISINIDPVTSIPGDEFVYKVTSFEKLP